MPPPSVPERSFDSVSVIVDPASELARLQQINNWYGQALAFANIGIYRWESVTDQWFWSDEIYDIRGFPRNSKFANPTDFYARVHPDDRERLLEAEIACKQGRAPMDVEYRFMLPDGALRWHRERANRLVLPDGSNEILSGALMDITAQKHAELNLARDRDRLEALVDDRTAALRIAVNAAEAGLRAKNMFVANISHELRTPMSGIMGMTSLALRRADDPKQREQLDKAAQCSQRLLGLINDLIDIADIEAERSALEVEAFQLSKLGEGLRDFFAPIAAKKGLRFSLKIEPSLENRTLYGDSAKLMQVVRNLADNALKFSDQGEIAIHFRIASEGQSQLHLHCSVEDQGIGILEADQQRIFSLFEQGDGSSTRRHGGTGLGLALCRKLVHLMKGEIGVTSHPGAGAKFYFTSQLATISP